MSDKPHDGPFYGDDDDDNDDAVVHQLESTNLRLIRDWLLIEWLI